MGATRPFREAGEMWCGKNSTAPPASAQGRAGDAGRSEGSPLDHAGTLDVADDSATSMVWLALGKGSP